ncbi:MAG: hypothetical protein LBT43_07510 [Prevotella sp.]|jgi:hypothetical protein|nr:hypothetical protein [Prevotella sp.]
MALRVFYGFTRLNKVLKKRSLRIIFENENRGERNLSRVKTWIHISHTRFQSEKEASDASFCNQMFFVYDLFIDEKPFNGDLEAVLEQNFIADSNHVSIEEREKIRENLRADFHRVYSDPDKYKAIEITLCQVKSQLKDLDIKYGKYLRLRKLNSYRIEVTCTISNADDSSTAHLLSYLENNYSLTRIDNTTYIIQHK